MTTEPVKLYIVLSDDNTQLGYIGPEADRATRLPRPHLNGHWITYSIQAKTEN